MKVFTVLGLSFLLIDGAIANCDETCLDASEYQKCFEDCSAIPISNEPPCTNDLLACGLGAEPTSADAEAAQAAATQISGCIIMKYAMQTLEPQCSAALEQAGGMDEVANCMALATSLCDPTSLNEDPVICLSRALPTIENQDATCADMVVNIVSLLADLEEAALAGGGGSGDDKGHGKHPVESGENTDLGLDTEEQVTVSVFLSFTLVILCLAFCSTLGCVKTCELAKSYKYGTIAHMEEDLEMISSSREGNNGSPKNPFNDFDGL